MKGSGKTREKDHLTNRRFADTDQSFRHLCSRADIPPTPRQASKFRMRKGKAFRSQSRTVTLEF